MSHRVRTRREALKCSQKALAEGVGLSRQSLTAIEAGRTTPSVTTALRIARFLACDVETLFGVDAADELEAALASTPPGPTGRVLVACVRERWVAHAMTPSQLGAPDYSADGFVKQVARAGKARVEPCRALSELRDTVLMGGCAPGLSVLADRLNGMRGPGRFRWLMQANGRALEALSRGHTHVAGVHLARNTPHKLAQSIARYLPSARAEVYALAGWEAGLVVARGNPRRIKGAANLANGKLRIALREQGSGARQQLDRMLEDHGCDQAALAARSFEVTSHMQVAHAVALGAADVGFSIRSAAMALDLSFVPLVEERFDLVIPDELLLDPRIRRMLDMLASSTFRRELELLGYDPRLCATKVADVVA